MSTAKTVNQIPATSYALPMTSAERRIMTNQLAIMRTLMNMVRNKGCFDAMKAAAIATCDDLEMDAKPKVMDS